MAHRQVFAGAVLVAPGLLLVLAATPWPWACLAILVVMGAAESGFASMQATLVMLGSPERARGGALGLLSACIGTGPLGALWIGYLTVAIGVPGALAVDALLAFLVIAPLALPLWRERLRPPAP